MIYAEKFTVAPTAKAWVKIVNRPAIEPTANGLDIQLRGSASSHCHRITCGLEPNMPSRVRLNGSKAQVARQRDESSPGIETEQLRG